MEQRGVLDVITQSTNVNAGLDARIREGKRLITCIGQEVTNIRPYP